MTPPVTHHTTLERAMIRPARSGLAGADLCNVLVGRHPHAKAGENSQRPRRALHHAELAVKCLPSTRATTMPARHSRALSRSSNQRTTKRPPAPAGIPSGVLCSGTRTCHLRSMGGQKAMIRS